MKAVIIKNKYKTILADPPWPEYGGGKRGGRRGANRHYPLMSVKKIKALDIISLADDSCHLYLWVTNNYLPAGLEVMKAWGFEYKTTITWAKDRTGLGQYFRGMTEHCLFGVKGVLPYKLDGGGKRQQGKTLIVALRTTHSKKPVQMHEIIERVSYSPYVELFARERRAGWDVWGNQAPAEITPLQVSFDLSGVGGIDG